MFVIRGGAMLRHPKRPDRGGTLACVVVSREDRTRRYLLTAGHVIGLNGYARQGDAIEAFVEEERRWIKVAEFETSTKLRDAQGARQACDAALARITDSERVSDEVEGIGVPYGIVRQPYEDMQLQFHGAASGLVTDARMYGLHRSVPITYENPMGGRVFSLTFEDQMFYRRVSGDAWAPATQPVDSGSLILDRDGLAVGMHIGRTPDDFVVSASVCTPIQMILDALNVDLPGQELVPAGLSGWDLLGKNALDTIGVPLQSLMLPHNAFGGVLWQLSRDGLIVDGRISRTAGALVTVPRVWREFGALISGAAMDYHIPVELIVATICTESLGNANAVRTEPRWMSDEATPDQVSCGLMQTLISTARSATGEPTLDRQALFNPEVSIKAGTAFIDQQRVRTQLDPPKVACAYNAGGLYINSGAANRWKMRQYPIGTGEHADRFAQWFNDCFAYFASDVSLLRPDVPSYFRLLSGG